MEQSRGLAGAAFILPKLKVRENAAGHLDVVPPSDLPPGQTSEGWWAAALRDWHVRKRPSSHHDPISFLAGKEITIGCEECGFRRQYQADDLIRIYGRDYWVTYLRYDLAACPKRKRFRECGVRYV